MSAQHTPGPGPNAWKCSACGYLNLFHAFCVACGARRDVEGESNG